MESSDELFMELANELVKNCSVSETAFSVGAVLTLNNKLISTGYSRELPGNTHAEECCIIKLLKTNEYERVIIGGEDDNTNTNINTTNTNTTTNTTITNNTNTSNNLTMYTTMEPCGKRLSLKECCADLLIKNKIKRVVIGELEPLKFIKETCGLNKLINSGIKVEFYKDITK